MHVARGATRTRLTEQPNGVKYESNEQHIGVAESPDDGTREHQEGEAGYPPDRDRDPH